MSLSTHRSAERVDPLAVISGSLTLLGEGPHCGLTRIRGLGRERRAIEGEQFAALAADQCVGAGVVPRARPHDGAAVFAERASAGVGLLDPVALDAIEGHRALVDAQAHETVVLDAAVDALVGAEVVAVGDTAGRAATSGQSHPEDGDGSECREQAARRGGRGDHVLHRLFARRVVARLLPIVVVRVLRHVMPRD